MAANEYVVIDIRNQPDSYVSLNKQNILEVRVVQIYEGYVVQVTMVAGNRYLLDLGVPAYDTLQDAIDAKDLFLVDAAVPE